MDLDWSTGRLVTIRAGTTARCPSLVLGQLVTILLTNTTPADEDAVVTVAWSDTVPPTNVTVPGTTGDEGLATYVCVSGDDTSFVSLSLSSTAGIQTVRAVIVGSALPTDTGGLRDQPLPVDGRLHPFPARTRYHAVPPDGWSRISVTSPSVQFVCLQARATTAEIVVVNQAGGLLPGQVLRLGPTASADGVVTVTTVPGQVYEKTIRGDGAAWVWMNGDNPEDSTSVKISLQGLSLLQLLATRGGAASLLSSLARRGGS